jgi:hypothetical protein
MTLITIILWTIFAVSTTVWLKMVYNHFFKDKKGWTVEVISIIIMGAMLHGLMAIMVSFTIHLIYHHSQLHTP